MSDLMPLYARLGQAVHDGIKAVEELQKAFEALDPKVQEMARRVEELNALERDIDGAKVRRADLSKEVAKLEEKIALMRSAARAALGGE